MNSIYKYPLKLVDDQVIHVPGLIAFPNTMVSFSKQVLKVDVQNDTPCIWAMVSTELEPREVLIRTFGTGFQFNLPIENYLGTYNIGRFVWHLFVDYTTPIN